MKTISYPLTSMLLALCFSIHLAYAQTSDSFYLRTQYIFQHLEKNRITTGMLQDYGIDFIDIENYDGVQLSDTNQVSSLKWQDLYESLYTYQINTNAPLVLSPDSVDQMMLHEEQNGVVPLSLLLMQYDKFRDDAATGNLITISNDQIYDRYVNGVWQNPYETHYAFAVGTAKDVCKTSTVTFLLPSNLVFNNAGTIQSIQADFADGNGWRSITPGQNITVSYADTGYKHIQFKVTLTNSQVFQSAEAIWVVGSSSAYSRIAPLDDAEITIPPSANNSGGTLEIHYSAANEATHQITKPLIIAEGFDPWKYETPYDSTNNTSFDDFWEYRDQYGITLQSLLEQDYDIIYLDYNDGTDDIERNAALLEEVIQKVDSLKALSGSMEKNVVMGISMGGLVARWALTDMEKKSENHDTRLFISYDAPMLGANVPLGFQALGAHLSNTPIKIGLFFGQIGYITTVGSLIKPLKIYETPAAQELLQYYVAANPLNGNLQMDNTAHTNFMNALYALNTTTHGYPTQCRNVAVSDGAECATELSTIQPGAQLFRLSGNYNTTFLSDLMLFGAGAILDYDIFTHTNYPQFILTTIPGRTDLKCNFTINATPASGSIQVYNGRIYLQKKILWLIPVNVTLTQNSFNSPSGVLPLDNYPGGQYNVNEVVDNVKGAFNGQSLDTTVWRSFINRGLDDFYQASPTFTFVTKASALDIGEGQVSLAEPDYLMRYEADNPPSPPKSTPFANFITAMNSDKINENHTQIDERFGNWMSTELNQSPDIADCSAFCSDNLSISGNDSFCNSGTYSISGLPAGTNVAWSASPSGIVSLSPNGSQVTVTKTTDGSIILQAAISSLCGTDTITKSVTVGSTPVSGYYYSGGEYHTLLDENSGANDLAPNTWILVNINSATGTIPQWTPEGGYDYSWHIASNELEINVQSDGYAAFEMDISGECGTISDTYIFVPDGSDDYTVSPNPAQNTITITANNKSKTAESMKFETPASSTNTIQLVKIFDISGKLRKQQIFGGNHLRVQMDISGLASGIYFVVISDGKHQETQKLVINR